MTLYDDRLDVARQITRELVDRFADNIRAVALEGSMARGPDAVDERSDIDLVVVARDSNAISERELFLDGVLISMGVTTAADLIEEAGELRWDWAMASEGFENFKPLYDPDGFFATLRARHSEMLTSISEDDITERSRALLMGAFEYIGKGERSLDHGSPTAASICASEALITMALCLGMFTRTRWSGSHLAVADTARIGRRIDGFADAYAEAADPTVDLDVSARLDACRRACDALRAHFERLGARSEVGSVRELFG